MSAPARLAPPAPLGLSPVAVGVAYCIASALAYTAANSCLMGLSDKVNQMWVICVKETVTVAVVGPYLACLGLRGTLVWPDRRALVALALVGLSVQLIGNLGMLWAFSVVGFSITIPAVMGINLACSALLGWLVLGEGVTRRTLVAISVLILAIFLLKMGADQARSGVMADWLRVTLALGACCASGLVFAAMAVAVRKTVTGPASAPVIVFVITVMGTLSLAPLSLWHLGLPGVMATPPHLFGLMLLAGVLNLIGFFTITKGLQYATVVQANVLGASQVAMAAVLGMLVFAERPSYSLAAGVGLTILGMIMIERPSEEAASQ